MKFSFLVALAWVITVLIVAAGCTEAGQLTPAPSPIPTPVQTDPPTPVPTPSPTPLLPLPATTPPAISLPKTIRDTPFLFTISAPDGYRGTSLRISTSQRNILYKTTIHNPTSGKANGTVTDTSGNYSQLSDSLTIFMYSASLSADQDIRTFIRRSGVVFNESSVTYNGITYARFDAESDPYSGTPGRTVFFAGNQASANEKGYLPVLIYTMTSDGTLSQATYENIVKSFRYYTGRTIGEAPGEETDRPPFFQ